MPNLASLFFSLQKPLKRQKPPRTMSYEVNYCILCNKRAKKGNRQKILPTTRFSLEIMARAHNAVDKTLTEHWACKRCLKKCQREIEVTAHGLNNFKSHFSEAANLKFNNLKLIFCRVSHSFKTAVSITSISLFFN